MLCLESYIHNHIGRHEHIVLWESSIASNKEPTHSLWRKIKYKTILGSRQLITIIKSWRIIYISCMMYHFLLSNSFKIHWSVELNALLLWKARKHSLMVRTTTENKHNITVIKILFGFPCWLPLRFVKRSRNNSSEACILNRATEVYTPDVYNSSANFHQQCDAILVFIVRPSWSSSYLWKQAHLYCLHYLMTRRSCLLSLWPEKCSLSFAPHESIKAVLLHLSLPSRRADATAAYNDMLSDDWRQEKRTGSLNFSHLVIYCELQWSRRNL